MKFYEGTCSICGGPGEGIPSVAFSWFAVHNNPDICRYYLELKARKLEQKEKKASEASYEN
jgi:hypothetical protein